MPRIFDNIEKPLLPALQETLEVAERADFCVRYFNLRGWRHLSGHVDRWAGGDGQCCRLLVGMHVTPSDELRQALRTREDDDGLDNQTALREKRRIAEEFRQQLTFGVPTNGDETALRQLSVQIRAKKLIVKVYLRHPCTPSFICCIGRMPTTRSPASWAVLTSRSLAWPNRAN